MLAVFTMQTGHKTIKTAERYGALHGGKGREGME
jgi:hypothetical protein